MSIVFILLIGFIIGNCSTFIPKESLRAVPICNVNEYDLHEQKIYPPESKVTKLREKIMEYNSILDSINSSGAKSTEIEDLKNKIINRIDTIRLTISVSTEKLGNTFSKNYNFSKAIETYLDALEDAEEVTENNKEANLLINRLRKNISVTRENGGNYLLNRIKSLVDQASYLYLDDQIDKAEDAMNLAKKEMEDSIFLNTKIIAIYTEQARIMKMYETPITPYCSPHFFMENLSKTRLNVISARFPESFQTRSGIKFTKILTKEGKPIYVSDRIRSNQVDSWYFARDYAEKMGKEENCSDCYRLPYREEIENLRSDGEGLWLQSWNVAPIGMIVGNLALGYYTFDYIHDIITHPLTWQSYLYPISPDSIYASRGGSWISYERGFRSTFRYVIGGYYSYGSGFRLVRPLQ